MYSLIGWCGMILVMESNGWDWKFQNQGEILLNCYIWIMKYIHVKILIYLVVERGAERKMSTNQTAAWKVLHNGYVATTTTSSPSSSSPLLKCHSHTLTAQFFSSNVSLIFFLFCFPHCNHQPHAPLLLGPNSSNSIFFSPKINCAADDRRSIECAIAGSSVFVAGFLIHK